MKTLFAFTICLFAFGAFAQEDTTANSEERSEILNFAVVETVPVMKGCGTLSSENQAEVRICFTQKLTEHVNKHFQFPVEARKLGVQGKVYVSFVVSETGEIENIELPRSIESQYLDEAEDKKSAAKELDEEAIRIIKLIQIEKPAMQRGKPVRMSFTMPISARLQ